MQAILEEPVRGILSEVDPGLNVGSADAGLWTVEYEQAVQALLRPSIVQQVRILS